MSKIEWTDETWNPVTGCTKVSAGCKHCYAEQLFPRPYPGRAFTDVQLHPERLKRPCHWRKPRRVFVNSMSDLFHEAVPDEFLDRVFAVMALSPQHTFQVLTKRPERMRDYLLALQDNEDVGTEPWADAAVATVGDPYACHVVDDADWPLSNVWLGVSVEDQEAADARIPLLMETPAAVRFLSCEPLLGRIDLRLGPSGAPLNRWCGYYCDDRTCLDWVIVGGESGPQARPCDLAWIRSLINQCRRAGVSCFVKQLGKRPVMGDVQVSLRDSKGGDPSEWPEDLRVREWPR